MANEAIRTALAEAYLGDTKSAKTVFSAPQTFDDRLISLLSGLGQGVDTPLNTAISGDDIKEFMAAFHATSNTSRTAFIQSLRDYMNADSAQVSEYADTPELSFLRVRDQTDTYVDVPKHSSLASIFGVSRIGSGPFGLNAHFYFNPVIATYPERITQVQFAVRLPYSSAKPLISRFILSCIPLQRIISIPSVFTLSPSVSILDKDAGAPRFSSCVVRVDNSNTFLPAVADTVVVLFTLNRYENFLNAPILHPDTRYYPNYFAFSDVIMPFA